MERFIALAEYRLLNAEWRIRQVPAAGARRIISKAAAEAAIALLEAKGFTVDSYDSDLVNWVKRLFVVSGEISVEHLATIAAACKYLDLPHDAAGKELGDDLRRVQAFVQTARALLVERQLQWVFRAPIDPWYDFTPPSDEKNGREFELEMAERHAADQEWAPVTRRKAEVAV